MVTASVLSPPRRPRALASIALALGAAALIAVAVVWIVAVIQLRGPAWSDNSSTDIFDGSLRAMWVSAAGALIALSGFAFGIVALVRRGHIALSVTAMGVCLLAAIVAAGHAYVF